MVIEVKLYGRNVQEILEIVQDLRRTGFGQTEDFDFKWEPAHYDWSGDAEQASCTTFMFYSEEVATFFRLKYD